MTSSEKRHRITEEDIYSCWAYSEAYLAEILNGEYPVEEAREDLLSLIGTKWDARGVDEEE